MAPKASVAKSTTQTYLLDQSVHSSVLATTHASDREVKNNPNLLLLNSIRVPTILIECGFVSNKAEAEKVQNPEYQEKLAQGIADGIDKYLNAASGAPRYGIQIQDGKNAAAKK